MSSAGVPQPWLERARTICLSFPEAIEQETWGHPTFRVRAKIFAGMGAGPLDISVPDEHRAAEHTTMSMKAALGEQASLLAVGFPFFRPKYVGSKGWIGIVITDATDWEEIAELVTDSYRAIAPKTLSRPLDDRRSPNMTFDPYTTAEER